MTTPRLSSAATSTPSSFSFFLRFSAMDRYLQMPAAILEHMQPSIPREGSAEGSASGVPA